MRKRKNDESCDWRIKKLFKKIDEKGQTLIEMMITVAIGLVVSAGIATVFVFAMQQISQLIEKNETEQSSLWAAYYLQKFISGAINVYAVPSTSFGDTIYIDANHNTAAGGCQSPANDGAKPNAVTVCGYGQFIYDFDAHNNLGGIIAKPALQGAYHTLAFFNREIAQPQGGGIPGSNIMASGIFVREPMTASNPADTLINERSYLLAFDTTSAPPLNAANSPLVYGQLHNIRVQMTTNCVIGNAAPTKGYKVEVVRDSDGTLFNCIPVAGLPLSGLPNCGPPLNPPAPCVAPSGEKFWVKTATLETAFRYFKSNNVSNFDYFWDGGSDDTGTSYGDGLASATMPVAYRDITQTVVVNFDNNVLTNQSVTGGANQAVRAQGSLYFFDTYVPMANAWGY